MKNKTKRILPIALIAIVLLSLLSVAEPVMALDECYLTLGTRSSQSSYGIHDTIEYEVKLCNHERATVSYYMTIELLDPDRDRIDYHRRSRSIPGWRACHIYRLSKSPPPGGWEPGIYTLRVIVTATGPRPRCIYLGDSDHTFPVGMPEPTPTPIPANVVIKPETLNLASKGEFTAFIMLPESYNIADIDISTVVCEGASAVKGMVADDNKYIAKFRREDLRKDLPIGDKVKMAVTGKVFYNGGYADFEGSDTIRVIKEGGKK